MIFLPFYFICDAQRSIKDTVFILREIMGNDTYHAVFVDKDKNSKYYNWITDFKFNSFDSISYNGAINLLKDRFPGGFSSHRIKARSKNWIPLYLYKNKYYAYVPSDKGYNNWIQITDTTFIEYNMEGPMPSILNSFRKIDQRQFQFGLWDIQKMQTKINAYIIDPKRQIAVFEFIGKNEKNRYKLMVNAGHIKYFPVIVNYCISEKVAEVEFQIPNYNRLINGRLLKK